MSLGRGMLYFSPPSVASAIQQIEDVDGENLLQFLV